MPKAISELTGKEVDTASPEWRFECEVRAVLAMPHVSDRRQYVNGVVLNGNVLHKGIRQQRGDAAAEEMIEAIKALHDKRMERK